MLLFSPLLFKQKRFYSIRHNLKICGKCESLYKLVPATCSTGDVWQLGDTYTRSAICRTLAILAAQEGEACSSTHTIESNNS